MKFSRATTLIALCAVSCLVILPSVVNAQHGTISVPGVKPTAEPGTKTTPVPTTSSTPAPTSKPSTTPPAATTTAATTTTHTAGTTTAPAAKPPTTSLAPVIPTPIAPPVPTGTGGVIGAACTNSDACGGLLCALTPDSPAAGTCQAMPRNVCRADPAQNCTTSADCNTAYSFCMNNNGAMVCVGLGTPSAADYCPNNTSNNNSGSGSLAPTIKYAGIAVGCVAALGLLFAGVRWQRHRQRSKVPENMFGEIDYGMTDRSAPKSAEQTYPFSSRPHAHGSDHAPSPPHDNGYDNQYYDDGYQKDQYYGNDQYNNNSQYYGNQQDNYGYDHHSGHGGQGGGFYDNVDYPQNGGHHSPIASPAAAVRSPRQNNFAAEPSELDYGGGNGGYGHGGHGGQGGQGGQGGYY
ncbi:hypothetical protein KI688_001371 [Linnemannia hyalina]|uniref:Uncharacterized protein n=1 Tax=Linnemannia hyalina TaxID=64524 RepID=A0A9P7XS79_9FUNG|nr:hypothetical protein KI688_001371 [Linnemannia hyalina]